MAHKILIIDDDKHFAALLANRLTTTGYEAMTASDGQLGLEAARKHRPDVIILDVIMPHMDGYQFCLLLRSDERIKDIPIIMLTSMGSQIDIVTGKALGAVEYMTKPFDGARLLETIARLIKKAK